MRKSITIKTLLLLLVVALTAGCVKVEAGLKITGSDVDFTYVIGMQKAYISMMTGEGDPFKDSEKELKDSGFTVEDYDDGSYKGIKASKKLGTLAELSTNDEVKEVTLSTDKMTDTKLFQVTSKGFFKTTYKASIKSTAMDDVEKMINSSGTTTGGTTTEEASETITTESTTTNEEAVSPDEADDVLETDKTTTAEPTSDETITTTGTEDTTGTDDLSDLSNQLSESMVVNFKVELPSTPGKNNATKVDGKTLTWDLKTFKDGTIEFEFSTLNMTNIILVCGGALLLLVIIIAVIVIASKKKGKVEPAEYADKPIPEVVKDEKVTPVVTTEDTPELTPVGEPKEKVEAQAQEETV